MKDAPEIKKSKVKVLIDKKLNQYNDLVLFPGKVAKAKQAFDKLGVPNTKTKPSF